MRYYQINWTMLMPDGSVERLTSQPYEDGQEAAYDVYQHWAVGEGTPLSVVIEEMTVADVPYEEPTHDAR